MKRKFLIEFCFSSYTYKFYGLGDFSYNENDKERRKKVESGANQKQKKRKIREKVRKSHRWPIEIDFIYYGKGENEQID